MTPASTRPICPETSPNFKPFPCVKSPTILPEERGSYDRGLAACSIKAATFADMYIGGDRERRPYEADVYIQQLGHYALDRDYALARKSHEYLIANPTWPTEWKFHSVMMAWADWMYTGNSESLAKNYAALKQSKTLESYVNADGLLDTGALMDIVDWPEGERDGYVLTPVNTVVNSFWCYILGLMADLANAQGNASDATRYRAMAATATAALNAKLWSESIGLYVDGQTTHSCPRPRSARRSWTAYGRSVSHTAQSYQYARGAHMWIDEINPFLCEC